jgi:CubicO group peptidase (beta-lactamase class C family)
MKIKTVLFILSIIVTILSCSILNSKELVKLPKVNNENSLDSAQAEIIYKYAQHYPNGTQLSICIMTDSKEKYVGIERRNDTLAYIINTDRIFEIGSITKCFTGIMLAKLVYDGKVNPNEPIKNILPIELKQSSLNGVEVTLTHLANHTSGLPFEPSDVKNIVFPYASYDRYDPYRNYTIERLYNYLTNKMILESTPGEKRTYSNLSLGLLGHILTLIAKKSYEQLLFETICNPLGMKNTFLTFNKERKRLLVQGRDENGKPLDCYENPNNAFIGCGSIKSTAKDLVKYLRANINDTTYFYLAQKTTKVNSEHFTGSLAWETYSEKGKHHVGAFGATGGYTSGIIFERNERVGIVILSNVSAYTVSKGNTIEDLCKELYGPMPFASETKK